MKDSLPYDLPAGMAVFLIALPLCLGIALASGAPLFSGLIAGIVGRIVVSRISDSALGVSGPAAGLVVIVSEAIANLGYEAFLLAVSFAGIFQVILGLLNAGIIGYYFPSAVITGLLSGIGIILFLKQIPHAIGYDKDYEGDISFFQSDDYTTITELGHMLDFISPGAIFISLISLAILLIWETPWFKQFWLSQWIHGALATIIIGVTVNQLFITLYPGWALNGNHLVSLPVTETWTDVFNFFTLPDFSQISNPDIYFVAITMAIIASLETLLSVEATDKLDPYKRITSKNLELKAQGIGNLFSGLIGGLPITQVVVRSSVNIQFGGRTKIASLVHGILLLIAVILVPELLNEIPLASLAAILLVVGYKLANPSLFKQMFQVGIYHFIPFMATILGMLFTDMLTGIAIGMGFGLLFIFMENPKVGFYVHKQHKANKTIIHLSESVTFLNKANIFELLDSLPNGSSVVIDASDSKYIDYDVYEIIQNFKVEAERKNITLVIQNLNLKFRLKKGVIFI